MPEGYTPSEKFSFALELLQKLKNKLLEADAISTELQELVNQRLLSTIQVFRDKACKPDAGLFPNSLLSPWISLPDAEDTTVSGDVKRETIDKFKINTNKPLKDKLLFICLAELVIALADTNVKEKQEQILGLKTQLIEQGLLPEDYQELTDIVDYADECFLRSAEQLRAIYLMSASKRYDYLRNKTIEPELKDLAENLNKSIHKARIDNPVITVSIKTLLAIYNEVIVKITCYVNDFDCQPELPVLIDRRQRILSALEQKLHFDAAGLTYSKSEVSLLDRADDLLEYFVQLTEIANQTNLSRESVFVLLNKTASLVAFSVLTINKAVFTNAKPNCALKYLIYKPSDLLFSRPSIGQDILQDIENLGEMIRVISVRLVQYEEAEQQQNYELFEASKQLFFLLMKSVILLLDAFTKARNQSNSQSEPASFSSFFTQLFDSNFQFQKIMRNLKQVDLECMQLVSIVAGRVLHANLLMLNRLAATTNVSFPRQPALAYLQPKIYKLTGKPFEAGLDVVLTLKKMDITSFCTNKGLLLTYYKNILTEYQSLMQYKSLFAQDGDVLELSVDRRMANLTNGDSPEKFNAKHRYYAKLLSFILDTAEANSIDLKAMLQAESNIAKPVAPKF